MRPPHRHQVDHAAAADQQCEHAERRVTFLTGRFRIPEKANTCLGLTDTFTA
jgi:hypothetical protein